jgi:hypothetical protein
MLNVAMLSVVMLNVAMLSVVAPSKARVLSLSVTSALYYLKERPGA